jgi:hypothetical protein
MPPARRFFIPSLKHSSLIIHRKSIIHHLSSLSLDPTQYNWTRPTQIRYHSSLSSFSLWPQFYSVRSLYLVVLSESLRWGSAGRLEQDNWQPYSSSRRAWNTIKIDGIQYHLIHDVAQNWAKFNDPRDYA